MRILYYIYGLNIGGAETFIHSVLSYIDFKRYHIDFILQSRSNENTKLLNLCREKGAKIYHIHAFHKSPIRSIHETESIIFEGNYDLIHIHQNAMINIGPIIAGRKCKIPVIMHSHNSFSNAGSFGRLVHIVNRKCFASGVVRLACSGEAGKWMYDDLDYKIVSNAISLKKYSYSEEYREEIRKRYNISTDTKVIGHMGRFVPAKNHEYILDIFKLIESSNNNVVLVLVGDGELKNHIVNRVKSESLTEKVIFTGNIDDAYKYYSAFDVLLFPSFFEGLPFTLVEAQASGLKCIVSDNVTKDVKVTNCIEYIDINQSITTWENRLIARLMESTDRNEISRKMEGSVYDAKQMIIEIEKIYDGINEKGYY